MGYELLGMTDGPRKAYCIPISGDSSGNDHARRVRIRDSAIIGASGSLLSIVRKRFPSISVVVFSGEFAPVTSPLVLADRYVQKGTQSVPKLKDAVRELLSVSPIRPQPAKPAPAPTWIPRSSNAGQQTELNGVSGGSLAANF